VGSSRQTRNNRKTSSQNRKSTSNTGTWGSGSFAAKISKSSTQRNKTDSSPNTLACFAAAKNKQIGPIAHQRATNLRKFQSNEQKNMKNKKHNKPLPSSYTKSGSSKFSRSSMTPQFKKWCESEMIKLMGTPDLTLVDFLMTVSDPSKVRTYVREYMNSKDGCEEFTDRFLLERDFANKHLSKKKSIQAKVIKADQISSSRAHINSSYGAFGALAVSEVPSGKAKKNRRRKKKSGKN